MRFADPKGLIAASTPQLHAASGAQYL